MIWINYSIFSKLFNEFKKRINEYYSFNFTIFNSVYIGEIINIIDKNEISKIGIMDILISLENHPNILQMMDYINNMIITLSNAQNYKVIMK